MTFSYVLYLVPGEEDALADSADDGGNAVDDAHGVLRPPLLQRRRQRPLARRQVEELGRVEDLEGDSVDILGMKLGTKLGTI